MTMLHYDGFEWMGSSNEHGLRTYLYFDPGGIQVTGRLFGFAGQITSAGFDTPSFGLRTTLYTGFAFKLTNSPSTNKSMAYTKGGVEQVRWEFIDNAGTGFQIVFKRGSTTLATSSTFPYGQWHYFEIKLVIDTGTAGSLELRRNELTDLTVGSLNTAAVGTSGADAFRYTWAGNNGTPQMDDWYINDSLGTENNTFLGDVAIEGFETSAEGATIEWTPATGTDNEALIDDGNGVSDTNNFNSSDTVGQKDLFVCGDLVFTTGQIFAVKLEVECAMASAGSRNVGVRYREPSGPTEFAGGNFAVSTTTYFNFSHIFELNPFTSMPWTNGDVNAGEFGYEVLA